MDIISHRQKCIKLADSSEHGWRVVQEYEAHPLAENSDDEKKIYRAQVQADRKIRQERRSRSRRYQPYSVPSTANGSKTDTAQHQSGAVGRKPGTCFRCGKPGHWRADCLVQNVQSEKNVQISRFVSNVLSVENNDTSGVLDSKANMTLNEKSQETVSNIEALRKREQTVSLPVGRLRSCLNHWEKSGASSFILDVVENGYKLPFKTLPKPVELGNNKSARDNADFVSREIQNLLLKGCIREVPTAPTVINPLTVAINRVGKKRLVLDCRHLNLELFKYKCCFENQSIAKDIFSKGDYLFTFDIKGAYHHIMIFPEHTVYLGFAWVENGVKRYFVYVVLPFGISTAGLIFTKVLRVCVSKWRNTGINIVVFLDDRLGGAGSFEASVRAANFVRQDLINFGSLLADDKCHWIPCMTATWLGFEWSTFKGTVKVSDERIERAISVLNELISLFSSGSVFMPVKKIACLVGHIISMQSVIGTNVRLHSRALYDCVSARATWDAPVKFTCSGLSEMIFWPENLKKFNCSYLRDKGECLSNAFDGEKENGDVEYTNVFVDASGSGFGGFIEGIEGSEIAGSWLSHERILSSTWRELESVYRIMSSCPEVLLSRKVIVNTDNKNVSSILKIGSKKPYLHEVSIKLHEFCVKNCIEMIPKWVPRTDNFVADHLSRCSDSDDWSISDFIFTTLENKWGLHTVDRFVCHYNAKCEVFNSRFWCPGTSGIDAFSVSWVGENNWVVPPPRLLSKCLNKIELEKSICTVVLPCWKSAPFWPKLFNGEKGDRAKMEFLTAGPYPLDL